MQAEFHENTVGWQMIKWCEEINASKPAFVFRGTHQNNEQSTEYTHSEILRLAACFGTVLADLNIKQGDVVCNTLPNCPERLVIDLGLMLAGVVAMNGVPFLADGTDLAKCLKRGKVVALVVDEALPHNALDVLTEKVTVRGVYAQTRDSPFLKRVVYVNCGTKSLSRVTARPWLEEIGRLGETFTKNPPVPSDMAFIFAIPGTSGVSKLVPRTHKEFLLLAETYCVLHELVPGDKVFNDNSLGSLAGAPFFYLARGGGRVLTDLTVPAEDRLHRAWQSIAAEHCTVGSFPPALINSTLSKQGYWKYSYKLPLLRTLITGGLPVSRQQVAAVGKLCENMIISYNTPESGFVSKGKVTQENARTFQDGDMGFVLDDYKNLIVTNSGKITVDEKQPGKRGELLLMGPQTFKGYVVGSNSLQDNLFTKMGYYRTEEVAYYSAHGTLRIVCHMDNVIMHASSLVYPGWMEAKLEKLDDIYSAVVVPIPCPRVYQELCVCIVTMPQVIIKEQALKSYCESLMVPTDYCQHMPVPKYYIFMEHFPVTIAEAPKRDEIFITALRILGL